MKLKFLKLFSNFIKMNANKPDTIILRVKKGKFQIMDKENTLIIPQAEKLV